MIVLEYILLVGVIVCAIAAPLCKRLLASVIVYMALSLMMAVLLCFGLFPGSALAAENDYDGYLAMI